MTKLCLAAAVAALSLSVFGSPAGARAAEKPPEHVGIAPPGLNDPKALRSEERGELARRRLEEQTDRLEAEARRAVQSICRGC